MSGCNALNVIRLAITHLWVFHAVINNFIQDINFLQSLQEELTELTFTEKNNDLYKFYQVYYLITGLFTIKSSVQGFQILKNRGLIIRSNKIV
jgi:hypothetical protein